MLRKILTLIMIIGSLTAWAHEGHDLTPGSIKANHGGTVKAGKEINLEYVVIGNTVKMYPVTHDGKDLLETDIILTGTIKLPKAKDETVKIEFKEGSFLTVVDFKKAYRVEINLIANFKGQKSNFKFQVEK